MVLGVLPERMESVLVVVDGSAFGISGLIDIVSRAAQRIQSTAGQPEQDPMAQMSQIAVTGRRLNIAGISLPPID